MSPTTAISALFGTKYFLWKSTKSARVSAASDSAVPAPGMPYGWKP